MNLDLNLDFNERQERLYGTLVFLGKMIFLGSFLHLVLFLEPDTSALQKFLAGLSNSLLGFTGVDLQQRGPLLVGENGSYLVTQDCLGWKSMFAFSALVLSSVSWKELKDHVPTVIAGIFLISVVNLFRVVTTVYLSYFEIISFEIIHTVFWKWGLTSVVLFLWISWLFSKGDLGNRKQSFI